MDNCENCGVVIGKLEPAFVINDHAVCRECHRRLSKKRSSATKILVIVSSFLLLANLVTGIAYMRMSARQAAVAQGEDSVPASSDGQTTQPPTDLLKPKDGWQYVTTARITEWPTTIQPPTNLSKLEDAQKFVNTACSSFHWPATIKNASVDLALDGATCDLEADSAVDLYTSVLFMTKIIGQARNAGAAIPTAEVWVNTPFGDASLIVPILESDLLGKPNTAEKTWKFVSNSFDWYELSVLEDVEKQFPATKLNSGEELVVIKEYLRQKAAGLKTAKIPTDEP